MTLRVIALVCTACVAVARADDPAPDPDGPRIPPTLRKAYEEGDYETVRKELLKAYTLAPSPQLLFALGQVEYNLGNYEAAIRYYEKYIETRPGERETALAQQAIGAARIKLAQPPAEPTPQPQPAPEPQPERPRVPPRQWYAEDTGLVALGGAAVAVGGGLLFYSHQLGDDRSGSLADYDNRVKQSRTTMWTGIGVASAGVVVIGVTLLRWRLRPDGPDITASAAPGSGTFVLTGRW